MTTETKVGIADESELAFASVLFVSSLHPTEPDPAYDLSLCSPYLNPGCGPPTSALIA